MTPWQVSHVQNVLGPTPSSPWSTELPRTHLSSLGSRRRKKRSWEHLQPALTPPWEHQHGLRSVWGHTSHRVHADQKGSLNPTTVAPGTGYSTPMLPFLYHINIWPWTWAPKHAPDPKELPTSPHDLAEGRKGRWSVFLLCFLWHLETREQKKELWDSLRSWGFTSSAPYSCWVKALHLKPLTASTEDPVTGLGTQNFLLERKTDWLQIGLGTTF